VVHYLLSLLESRLLRYLVIKKATGVNVGGLFYWVIMAATCRSNLITRPSNVLLALASPMIYRGA
jgi:hypothetical protein